MVTPSGERTLTVSATGYTIRGRTSTGIPTAPGVVAVDPSVIPLGTRLTIPGYGVGIAADTGGAVHGNTIDVWFADGGAGAPGGAAVTVTVTDPLVDSRLPKPRGQRWTTSLRSNDTETHGHPRAARRRPRPLPHRAPQSARGAGRRHRRRGVERIGGAAPRARVGSRRGRDGPEHAGDERRRGDAPHQPRRPADPSGRADDLRPGAGRDGRDPRRSVRLPAQGRVDPGADAGPRGRRGRRVADLAAHRRQGAPARARHDRRARGGRHDPRPSSPTARSRC